MGLKFVIYEESEEVYSFPKRVQAALLDQKWEAPKEYYAL